MNKAQKRPTMTKVLSMILALIMVLSLLPLSGFTADTQAAGTSTSDFMRIFHLDCGRKYFTVDQINDLIDTAAENNYTHVELAIGNDALRFLLNDMSLTVNGTTYSSDAVKEGIQSGNKTYYDTGSVNELTQANMDDIISHAKGKNISIIPLINSPGHMDAIIDCMKTLGISKAAFTASGSYGTSARTIDLNNTQAVAFTQALVQKYANYFAGKGCKYFNIGADEYANDILGRYSLSGGAGFGYLIENGLYGKFITYVNDIASIVDNARMTPIAFNDGIYYNGNTSSGTFDPGIVISYWSSGYSGYAPTSAANLAAKGHKIINTNDAWYYVLNDANSSYTYSHASSGVSNTSCTTITGDKNNTASIGCMLAFWCDEPSCTYSNNEITRVKYLIKTLSASNPTYFTTVAPAEPEILTGNGSTKLDVNGGSTTLSISDGSEATWTVDPADGSVIKLIAASNADGDVITGTTVEAVAVGKGTATVTATVGEKVYTMELTVEDPNEVLVEVPAGGNWTTTVKDVDLSNQVGDYDESVAKVKVSYDKKDGGVTVTPVTSVNSGIEYYIQNSSGQYLNSSAKWVDDYTSAAKWTVTSNNNGYYLQSGNDYLRYNNGWTTTNRNNQKTNLYFNDGTLYRTRTSSGNPWNPSYSYSNPLGSPVTIKQEDPINASTITITGVTAGQETTVKIGNVIYRIKVTDEIPSNALTSNSISLEYWITNIHTHTSASSTAATSQTITKNDAQTESGIEIKATAPENTYSDFTGNGWTKLYYWQAIRLDSANNQTTGDGDDKTSAGTKLTHVRYYNGAWQYKTVDNVWHYFLTGDQLVAYYLQRTNVTKEVLTYAKDWGYGTDKSYETPSAGQVALTVAVVYPDGTVSPTEGEMYANSTTIFNFWNKRDIGIVAPENNSKYNISKITVTDGNRTTNTGSNTWTSTDEIEWNKTTNAAGRTWYDETEVWNKSSGTTPMVNGSSKEDLYVWSAKNTAKLVLIYLERVEQTTDLQVVYKDDNSGNQIHQYKVGVKYIQDETVPTFKTALMDASDNVIGGTANWPGKNNTEAGYLPDDAYVINDSDVKQKFNKVLTQIPDITGVYASGLYEYVGADISDDGKTLTLHYNLKKSDQKTFVVDFGLPIVIPMEEFGIENIATTVKTVSFDEKDATMTERTGDYGTGKIDMSAKTVTYTLIETLDNTITIPIYVTFTDNTVKVLSVFVVPASNVYYEDSFAKFENGTGAAATAQWSDETDGTAAKAKTTQALEALDSKENVYGYDSAYADSTKYSMGSAHKVTVSSAMADKWADGSAWPTATFTFKGTGFDIISLTDNTSGTIFVDVYQGDKAEGKAVRSYFVDNYYGYTKNDDGEWVVDQNANNALYQIPVMKVTDLDYDTYTVVISVEYDSFFDKTGDNEYTFVLDAIRVYNPMGEDNDTYVQDDEGYPQYIKLRDKLASGNASAEAVFIDGSKAETEITNYANYGPNNEVYLAKNQAISFNVPNAENIASVQIGAKSPDGGAKMKVTVGSGNAVETEISTATEMYYQLEGASKGQQIVIANTGDKILSLTNLKITFTTKQSDEVKLAALTDEDQANAVATVRALFAAPTPEVKTFEPKTFKVALNKDSIREGQKATLTVKTSADVEAITVNGDIVKNYNTRYERSGWGWWAEKVECRVFTVTLTPTETTDYEVAAVNAEGTASEPVTCTLTVKPAQTNWWDDIWNGFFGKWF